MDENELKQVLKGKRILIVDDRVETVEPFGDTLESLEASVDYAESIQEAIDFISTSDYNPAFDLVVIDLNIPDVLPILSPYKSFFKKIHLNRGQVFGLWLSDKYSAIPYFYFSVVPNVKQEMPDSQTGIKAHNKHISLDDFAKIVVEKISKTTS
jgi:hypothetical protein